MTEPSLQEERTALYLIYDRDDRLLYVGAGFNPILRWTDHNQKPWWRHVANCEVQWFDTREEAEAAEQAAIATRRPLYNVVHDPERSTSPGSRLVAVPTGEVARPVHGPEVDRIDARLTAGEWIQTKDVVTVLGAPVWRVRRLAKLGRLRTKHTDSGALLYHPEDVLRAIDAGSRICRGSRRAYRPHPDDILQERIEACACVHAETPGNVRQ